MNDEIKIVSLNTQSLDTNGHRKRRDVLHHVRKKKFSIICVQDTHFTGNMENVVRAEWGHAVYFSSFSSA